MTCLMLLSGVVGAIVGAAAWWLSMLGLRHANWESPTQRRRKVHDDGKLAEDKKYHNQAIYRDFEYFFKVTLAILGGIAFVATRVQAGINEALQGLLTAAKGFQLVAGMIFALFIFFHQKSKIERWKDYFSWWKPFSWQECWMVASMFAISAMIAFAAIPYLLCVLSRAVHAG